MRKREFKLCFMMFFTLFIGVNAQTSYFTNVNSKQIKTLQVKVAGEMISNPFIVLGGEEQILMVLEKDILITPTTSFIVMGIGHNQC